MFQVMIVLRSHGIFVPWSQVIYVTMSEKSFCNKFSIYSCAMFHEIFEPRFQVIILQNFQAMFEPR